MQHRKTLEWDDGGAEFYVTFTIAEVRELEAGIVSEDVRALCRQLLQRGACVESAAVDPQGTLNLEDDPS